MPTLYDVLDVDANATDDELKAAYRRAARTAHPDVGGDENAMKQVNDAYQTLRDPHQRTIYDHDLRIRLGDEPAADDRTGTDRGERSTGHVPPHPPPPPGARAAVTVTPRQVRTTSAALIAAAAAAIYALRALGVASLGPIGWFVVDYTPWTPPAHPAIAAATVAATAGAAALAGPWLHRRAGYVWAATLAAAGAVTAVADVVVMVALDIAATAMTAAAVLALLVVMVIFGGRD